MLWPGARGKTSVVVSHEMAFARQRADRCSFMTRTIIEKGPPDTLFLVLRKTDQALPLQAAGLAIRYFVQQHCLIAPASVAGASLAS